MAGNEKIHEIMIRSVRLEDAAALLEIYAPYVRETAITFEYEVPSVSGFEDRIRKITARYPYIVAERDGEILGYSYASRFKERAAYDWCVETTIYVKKGEKGNGVGRRLYERLEEALKSQNILNANACIAYPNPESIGFHEHMGYRTIAHFTKCGYKLGTWYDMIWMEKMLGEHKDTPLHVVPFPDTKAPCTKPENFGVRDAGQEVTCMRKK